MLDTTKNVRNYTGEFAGLNKVCDKCSTEFKAKRAKTTTCQSCRKRSPDEIRKSKVKAVSDARRRIKVKAVEYKGGCCEKCGYDRCISALEFHHIDPTEKDFSIGVSGSTRGWDKVKLELDKCILVCANCHREIHSDIDVK